jgi:hypothetical protein
MQMLRCDLYKADTLTPRGGDVRAPNDLLVYDDLETLNRDSVCVRRMKIPICG